MAGTGPMRPRIPTQRVATERLSRDERARMWLTLPLPRQLAASVHAGIVLIIGAVGVLRWPRATRIVVLVAIAWISLASSSFILRVVMAARLVAVSLPVILSLVFVLGV